MPEGQTELTLEKAQFKWGKVLKEFVTEKGEVDFGNLARKKSDLDAYVGYIAKNGPISQPNAFADKGVLLAHYLNSYNALSMYNILDSGVPESLAGLKKVKFFFLKKFIIDGREMSLYTYENEVIRKLGEERVHFALNCMSRGCPRLPKVPFTGKNIERELQQQAKLFFSEERNLKYDSKEKKVYLSEILDFFPDDFLKKAKTLVAYANQHRTKEQQLPEEAKVEFIPYDWKVNNINKQ
jgi:hypothetical protein